jgi:hypothetical protein
MLDVRYLWRSALDTGADGFPILRLVEKTINDADFIPEGLQSNDKGINSEDLRGIFGLNASNQVAIRVNRVAYANAPKVGEIPTAKTARRRSLAVGTDGGAVLRLLTQPAGNLPNYIQPLAAANLKNIGLSTVGLNATNRAGLRVSLSSFGALPPKLDDTTLDQLIASIFTQGGTEPNRPTIRLIEVATTGADYVTAERQNLDGRQLFASTLNEDGGGLLGLRVEFQV